MFCSDKKCCRLDSLQSSNKHSNHPDNHKFLPNPGTELPGEDLLLPGGLDNPAHLLLLPELTTAVKENEEKETKKIKKCESSPLTFQDFTSANFVLDRHNYDYNITKKGNFNLNDSLDTQDTETMYGSIENIKIIDDKMASLEAADLNVSDATDYMNIPGLQVKKLRSISVFFWKNLKQTFLVQ